MGPILPKTGPTPDERMNRSEKEALIDQTEAFEGPDRRELRGTRFPADNDSGVGRS